MWLFNRRFILFAPLALGACGFEPVYKANTPARAILGQIDIEVKAGRFDFALRNRLRELLGQAGPDAPYVLRYVMTVKSTDLVISDTADIIRFVLDGQVAYQIYDRAKDIEVYAGQVDATTAYSATAGTYQTEVARKDANIRLSYAMAQRIVDQLAVTAKDWLK